MYLGVSLLLCWLVAPKVFSKVRMFKLMVSNKDKGTGFEICQIKRQLLFKEHSLQCVLGTLANSVLVVILRDK